jgi:exodeoxyribonuclease VII large subunit
VNTRRYPGSEDSPRRGQIEQPDIPGSTRESAVSITELNERTKNLIDRSYGQFWVHGEVTDFKKYRSGHWYFTLRDGEARMSCVVWGGDQWRIPAAPDEGMKVIAFAQMTFYPAKGALQLRITRMDAAGDGLHRKAMELTIAKLTEEGLMAPERKRALPRFPRVIGVVTSMSGAALRDIIAVAHRRRPGFRMVVAGASVQGEFAAEEICNAIDRIVRWGRADVLIVGRGGGSREDLHAFNDERVARAIAKCRIPTISAVGHEVDITVCDLVADVRAATPSAAAETAIPSLSDMTDAMREQRRRLVLAARRRGDRAAQDLKAISRDMRLASLRSVEGRRALVSNAAGRLNALSPLATLARGYAVARGLDGSTLSSVADFVVGEEFELMVRDGRVTARTQELKDG